MVLRVLEAGLSVADLELMPVGMLFDIITEKSYDEKEYIRMANQKDFDKF